MVAFFGEVMTKLNAETPTTEPGSVNGDVKVFNEKYSPDGTENDTDTIELGFLPKGARILFGLLQTDDAQGTVTVCIGIAGDTTKYRLDAILVPNVVQIFGLVEGDVLTADETIIMTLDTSDFDMAGTIRVKIFYTLD